MNVRIEEKQLNRLATLATRFLEAYLESVPMEPTLPGGGLPASKDLIVRTNELLDHAVDLANHINQSLAAQRSTQ